MITDIEDIEDPKSDDHLQPLIKEHQNSRHSGSYIFFALEQNTKYEVRIQARNIHGWGQFSQDVLFSTSSTGRIAFKI